MKKIQTFIAAFTIAVFGALAVVPATTVMAIDPFEDACSTNPGGAVCDNKDENANDLIWDIVNILLYIVGILSVIMIIVGGIMYTTSAGDSGRVTKAKNTLMYSIVGVVVAFLAYAIINWVILAL